MVNMICNILLNKFDCFIVIEGNRGLGKSTLAWHLAYGVRREMKRRGLDGYKFLAKRDLLYKRENVIRFFRKWQKTGIADEMINVSFNRDFYNEDQKDLIKIINMNRDHNNLFLACVPQFQTLDSQIKNLCKIRITVIRRGMAVIQTPNRTIYGRDKWDQMINEKIERKWLENKIKNPKYTRLTTFRGMIKFPALTEKQEERYQAIKDQKRNEVWKEKENSDDEKPHDPFEECYERLIKGGIKNRAMIEGYAFAMDKTPATLVHLLVKRLKKEKRDASLPNYYYENKRKQILGVEGLKPQNLRVSKIVNSLRDN